MVLHAAVVEHVATNLATPFDFLLTGFHLCLLAMRCWVPCRKAWNGAGELRSRGSWAGLVSRYFQSGFLPLRPYMDPYTDSADGRRTPYLIDVLSAGATTSGRYPMTCGQVRCSPRWYHLPKGVTNTDAKEVIRLPPGHCRAKHAPSGAHRSPFR